MLRENTLLTHVPKEDYNLKIVIHPKILNTITIHLTSIQMRHQHVPLIKIEISREFLLQGETRSGLHSFQKDEALILKVENAQANFQCCHLKTERQRNDYNQIHCLNHRSLRLNTSIASILGRPSE